MNAILIISYDTDFFIEPQLNRIKNLCEDEAEVFVVDNTTKDKGQISKNIERVCEKYNVNYSYFGYTHECGSVSHCTALNEGFKRITSNKRYERFITFDQDLIPFYKFKTHSDYPLKGLKQEREGCVYIEPIYSSFDLRRINTIDFLPAIMDGNLLDGGAWFYPIIRSLPPNKVKFIELKLRFSNTNKFHEILDKKMFHFIRGSNWGTPEAPSLSCKENLARLEKLSEEYNKLSQGYKIQG